VSIGLYKKSKHGQYSVAPLFCEFFNLDQGMVTESVSMFACIPRPKLGTPEPFLEIAYKELADLEKGFVLEDGEQSRFVRIVLVLNSGKQEYIHTYIHALIFVYRRL
jgi:hypothetical protein